MIITKKIRFVNIICFCLKHFLIFLILSDKTAKNQKFYGFSRYFRRSRNLLQLWLFFP